MIITLVAAVVILLVVMVPNHRPVTTTTVTATAIRAILPVLIQLETAMILMHQEIQVIRKNVMMALIMIVMAILIVKTLIAILVFNIQTEEIVKLTPVAVGAEN